MELKGILENFHFFETSFPEYKVVEDRAYKKEKEKILLSGRLKPLTKQKFIKDLEHVTDAFKLGKESQLEEIYDCHQFVNKRTQTEIAGDFHIAGNYVVVWLKKLDRPIVEFQRIGSHNTSGVMKKKSQ
jgi:mRNA-degrading endonuclease YafQ of YafQ-DinJ toxin-antitoxin module